MLWQRQTQLRVIPNNVPVVEKTGFYPLVNFFGTYTGTGFNSNFGNLVYTQAGSLLLTVLSAANTITIYRSTDQGISWNAAVTITPFLLSVNSCAMIQLQSGRILVSGIAGTGSGKLALYYSDNDGLNWSGPIEIVSAGASAGMITQSGTGRVILQNVAAKQYYYSDNDGANWILATGTLSKMSYTVGVTPNGDIIGNGIFSGEINKSIDNGETWAYWKTMLIGSGQGMTFGIAVLNNTTYTVSLSKSSVINPCTLYKSIDNFDTAQAIPIVGSIDMSTADLAAITSSTIKNMVAGGGAWNRLLCIVGDRALVSHVRNTPRINIKSVGIAKNFIITASHLGTYTILTIGLTRYQIHPGL